MICLHKVIYRRGTEEINMKHPPQEEPGTQKLRQHKKQNKSL